MHENHQNDPGGGRELGGEEPRQEEEDEDDEPPCEEVGFPTQAEGLVGVGEEREEDFEVPRLCVGVGGREGGTVGK